MHEARGDLDAAPAFEVLAAAPDSTRALVVDVAPRMCEFLTAILSSASYACIEAADGAAAFNHVIVGGIDLVITNLDMPGMDGFGLMSAIGLLPASVGCPAVIVVSGLLDVTLADRRSELRAAALLAKLIDPAVLLAAVARAMSVRRSCR